MASYPRKKPGWYGEFVKGYRKAIKVQANGVLLGDSIVYHLQRYPNIWNRFRQRNFINMGIRGDLIQNVLWRIEHMHLPSTTSVGVIHCGINNIRGFCSSNFSPQELAFNVISCGVKLSELNPKISIIIMGILPTEDSFPGKAFGFPKLIIFC